MVTTGQRETSSQDSDEILQGCLLIDGSSFLAKKSGPGCKTIDPVAVKYVKSAPLRKAGTSLIRPPDAREIKNTAFSNNCLIVEEFGSI